MNQIKRNKNKLTVYLIKNGYVDVAIKNKKTLKSEKLSNDDNVVMYIQDTFSNQPTFLQKFFLKNPSDYQIYSASAKVALMVKLDNQTFAVTFGNGRHLLNMDTIERRFGLRTALNMLDENSIKNISKTKLESNPKNSNEQLSKVGDKNVFGVNIDQDLIKGISGKIKAKYAELGKNATGSDAFTITAECDIKNIVEFLTKISKIYTSEEYKTNFGWIDQIQPIKDKNEIDKLDNLLIAQLNSPSNTNGVLVWASTPEYTDWENLAGFKIKKDDDLLADFSKQDIIDAIGSDISKDGLCNLKISAISSENDTPMFSWSAYKCLYTEIRQSDKVYLLVDGDWFEISKDFAKDINDDFKKIAFSDIDFCDYSNDYKKEADYNKKLAERIGGRCLDAQNISYGGGYSKIEVCDVYTKDGDLIHIKHYSGSSTLSHLFNQGFVSGELLNNDGKFREKVKTDLLDGQDVGDVSNRKIIYGIITTKSNKFDIPFFSKITLKNARRQLQGMGYTVQLAKIKNTQVEEEP
jgi:uncharacterized protein (TIGR04141 family)